MLLRILIFKPRIDKNLQTLDLILITSILQLVITTKSLQYRTTKFLTLIQQYFSSFSVIKLFFLISHLRLVSLKYSGFPG